MKHPFDVHVGARLRKCRQTAGLTRSELGAKIGVQAQELQSIEDGEGPIDSGVLRNVVAVVGVSPAFFFEGLAEALRGAA
jgi:transcriptional regulator with XRE-family HTH domain